MCGRFTLTTPASKLMELFRVNQFPPIRPRYNIAPSQQIVCIRLADGPERIAQMMRWGLIPSWAKDESVGYRMINARSETASQKPAFRRAFRSGRCVIPADGFYEWQKLKTNQKQPWYIRLQDGRPFAFAGLMEVWRPPNTEAGQHSEILSCTILTTSANRDVADIHDRMPVILFPEQTDGWLNQTATVPQLQSFLKPLPEGVLTRYRVSTLVNSPRNDVPECIQPIDASEEPASLFD